MQLEAKKHLEDILLAAESTLDFTRGKTYDDYCINALLRSGVERQFQIMGEALNRLLRTDPVVAESIENCRRIIAFRNILVHAYDVINDRVVWDVVSQELPELHARVVALLEER